VKLPELRAIIALSTMFGDEATLPVVKMDLLSEVVAMMLAVVSTA
tara:strand:+ start:1775 stop:1909 length:135 start_codon:yes stop_codon:yes gene_type:complete